MSAAAAQFKRGINASLGKGVGSRLIKLGGLLYVLLAAGTAVSNTTAETASASVALVANEIDAGTTIEIEDQGIVTAKNAAETLRIRLFLNASVIATVPAVNVSVGDIYHIKATVVFRTAGASGTWVATGFVSVLGADGTATSKPFHVASTVADTTGVITFATKHTWSAANAGNSSRCDVFVVKRFGFEGAVAVET